jgi:glycine cleavage system transcriptional repressor
MERRSMQQTHFVLTLSGPDRIGVVDELTGLLLERGGNVETSRMARLGGEFAVLMLVSMRAEAFADLDRGLEPLTSQGYKTTITPAGRSYAEAHPGWVPYTIEVHGGDHEGIIHEVAHYLSEQGISIEAVDSGTTPAPISGSPLFAMTARVAVPPELPVERWQDGLDEIGNRLNLEVRVSASGAK